MTASLRSFGTADWIVLAVYIVLTLGIGVYASAKKGKRRSKDQEGTDAESYFLAGRSANFWVIAVSLVSGLTSGISFLGSTGYTYKNGFALTVTALSPIVAAPIIVFVLIPFFKSLKAVSAYTFLEARFDRGVRNLASTIFIVRIIAYLGLVLYAPAIAVKALSGLNEAVSIVIAGTLTTLYTAKGGMPSVVWTDFLQTIVLTFSTVYILYKCYSSSTLDFEGAMRISRDFFVPNPTHDLTLYSAVIGVGISSLAQGGTDQVAIQRYLTTPDLKACQRAAMCTWILNGIYCGLLGITGVAMYAYYQTAQRTDPLANGDISSCDMIIPFFASHDLAEGSAGIVVAGIVGCTMSVCGAGLNSASTCLVLDLAPTPPGGDVVRRTRLATFLFGALSVSAALVFMVAGDTLITLNQVGRAHPYE
eukprot:g2716.t1